jgi:hypothetical protein
MSEFIAIGMEEGLLSSDATTRIVARATASRWVQGFQEWLDSEMKRGENPAHVLIAMMRLQIMLHSSLTANFIGPDGFQDTADGYKTMIDVLYVRHAQECAKAMKEKRGRR